MRYCSDCRKTFKLEDGKHSAISISGIGIRTTIFCPYCDSPKNSSVFIESSNVIQEQIKSSEYKKLDSNTDTLQDFKDMVSELSSNISPSVENDTWLPCEINN